ncbi:Tyrosine-protein kinase transmembrane receptor Ror [Holothuria leucospilota]|uniref:Tyrosine-protein kinase transmembrane receptor Ror n=1 Tax=Holothuria leucospilota TaxID=206669 RepID=A0A9Q0YPT5_HOLLE|nr:Tyrosine-protein kinase transmembrane receptor Ror [Holothuria leucospilota]
METNGLATPVVILPDKFGPIDPQDGHGAVERKYIPDPIITGITPSKTTPLTPPTPSKTEQPFLVYIVITGITVVLVFILCLLVIRLKILRKETSKEENPVFSIRISHHSRKVPVLPEFREKEIINIYDVELSEEAVGRGQFGEVFKATLNLGKGNLKKQTVAVKRSKENLNAALQEEFLDEIRLMIEIGNHPNIMPLLACRTVAEPYYLITEYMKYGSLKDYLHKSSIPEIVSQDPNYNLTDLRKLQFSHQISKGMEYLATTRFFHGDLAARNVLINEEMVVKISDFGLSNDIYAKGYVRLPEEQKRPVKWYSPEANYFGKCSTESDVWSFGVVLYEIYSGGQEPYPGMLPGEVIVRVKAGYRMERPENCPNQIYIIMRDCWQHEPSNRPSFELIRQTLDEMLSRGDDPYFDPIGDHERVIDNNSSSAESVDRVSIDSFIYDASLNITNSRMIPYIDEDPKLSKENDKGADGK